MMAEAINTSHINLLICSTLVHASIIPLQTFKVLVNPDSSISFANSISVSPNFKTQQYRIISILIHHN